MPNHYYRSDEEYLQAIADVLHREYRAIVDTGSVLQLDAPDLASRSGSDPSKLLRARPNGLTLVAANGRHAWEWRVWEDVKLPEGKVLMAGVIDSTTNIIEHPETVAEHIERFARVVGKENLIAGVDCGFQTSAGRDQVDPDIAWAKLASLAEGARRASERLLTYKRAVR